MPTLVPELMPAAEAGAEPSPAVDAIGEPEAVGEQNQGQPTPGDEQAGEESHSHPALVDSDGDHQAEGMAKGPVVYGDSAYGSAAVLALLAQTGATPMVKVLSPHGPGGHFPKDRFGIDLLARTVTCPNGIIAPLRPLNDGGGHASFGKACSTCPLRAQCTTAKDGRVITVSAHEALLEEARRRQADPAWQADYRATRPKVERKQAHLMRRRHGGRRARVRGRVRVAQDFKLLAAAANFARLAVLGVSSGAGAWAVAPI